MQEKEPIGQTPVVWHDPRKAPFSISGLLAVESDGIFRRLPVKTPESLPQAVNQLAWCTTGGQLRFRTDSPYFSIKVKLKHTVKDLSHMAATGQSGFDVYIRQTGKWQYFRTAIPPLCETNYESIIWDLRNGPCPFGGLQEVLVNFPLYQGVEELWIGLLKSVRIDRPAPFDSNRKMIFYGTSITQGGCASRPGMSYTNILSRRINMEFINLGFSGSGKGELEVALAIREIKNPACLVLDYEANCTAEIYENTLERFIGLYRERHQEVPILVVSRIPYSDEIFCSNDSRRRIHSMQCVESLQSWGDKHIYFLDGLTLLGDRWDECTVDGIHPNDFGFMNIADGMEEFLMKII